MNEFKGYKTLDGVFYLFAVLVCNVLVYHIEVLVIVILRGNRTQDDDFLGDQFVEFHLKILFAHQFFALVDGRLISLVEIVKCLVNRHHFCGVCEFGFVRFAGFALRSFVFFCSVAFTFASALKIKNR